MQKTFLHAAVRNFSEFLRPAFSFPTSPCLSLPIWEDMENLPGLRISCRSVPQLFQQGMIGQLLIVGLPVQRQAPGFLRCSEEEIFTPLESVEKLDPKLVWEREPKTPNKERPVFFPLFITASVQSGIRYCMSNALVLIRCSVLGCFQ